ncbi:hypothetical protein MZA92_02165 [Haemophilus influenzae]
MWAYAPIAGVLLGVSDIEIPWNTLILSTVLYVLLPCWQAGLPALIYKNRGKSVAQFSGSLKPFSVDGLDFDGGVTVRLSSPNHYCNPLIILLIAIPLLAQTYGIFALAHVLAKMAQITTRNFRPALLDWHE